MMMIQRYIILLAVVIVSSAVVCLLIFFRMKKKGKGAVRLLGGLLCFWSFFLIIFATIILFNLPLNYDPASSVLNLQPFQWLWEDEVKRRIVDEIIPNILLFVPFGVFAPIVFKQLRKFFFAALAVFVLTFGIEVFQFFIGRSSDIDDLMANLLGGIIGFVIFMAFGRLFKNKTWWNQLTGLLPIQPFSTQ